MKWDDLALVLALSRHDSVAEAARALALAPSTVYRRLDGVEAALGAQLFDRGAARWTPTTPGAELIALAADTEARLQAITERVGGRDQEHAGLVRLTVPEGLAAPLCRLLPELRTRHPRIVLQLDATSERRSLLDREVDVAVRVTASPPASLVGRRLAVLRFAVAGAVATGVDADRLDEAPWVVFGPERAQTPQGRWERANVPDARVALRTSSRVVFDEAVQNGVGVGVTPLALARRDGRLRVLGEPIEGLDLPLWVLTHEDLRDVARIRAVLDFLVEVLGDALR